MITKQELVNNLATSTGLPKAKVESLLTSLSDNVQIQLKESGKIALPGIGLLKTTKRPERKGINPKTGQALMISARTAILFKPTPALKSSL